MGNPDSIYGKILPEEIAAYPAAVGSEDVSGAELSVG